jgi:hypothetical protein
LQLSTGKLIIGISTCNKPFLGLTAKSASFLLMKILILIILFFSFPRLILSLDQHPVTFMYLVGIEGVGHHFLIPLLATLTNNVYGYHLKENDLPMRNAIQRNDFDLLKQLVKVHRHIQNLSKTPRHLVIVETYSFPFLAVCRLCPLNQIAHSPPYNLKWMFNAFQSLNVTTKFLFLNRDFYRTVYSHTNFDSNIMEHTRVMSTFLNHIYYSYNMTESIVPDTWARLDYEWLSNATNCEPIISALADFLGWDKGLEKKACVEIVPLFKPTTSKSKNMSDYDTIMAYYTPPPMKKLVEWL